MITRMKPYKLLLLLLLNSVVTGCGQPGPLYLPGQVAPIHVEPEPAQKPKPKPEQAPKPEQNK
jgi:predicted small lipoprotein YifL